MNNETAADWQHYWDTSVPTSVAGAFENGYDGQIFEFWQNVLAGQTGLVVDLACGNGALTWVVDKILNNPVPTTKITGVDFAKITPFETLKKNPADFPNMSFIGDNGIEVLPFDDSSVDVIVSQWGVEYSNLEKTIPEISRVLKDRSMIGFLCHHDESDLLDRSRRLYAKYQVILKRPEIFEKLFSLNELFNSKTNIKQVYSDPQYVMILGEINQLMSFYNEEFEKSPDDTITDMQKYLKGLMGLFSNTAFVRNPKRKQNILKNKDMLYLSAIRMEDLFRASRSPSEFETMLELIKKEGFNIISQGKLMQDGMGNIGKTIVATRGY